MSQSSISTKENTGITKDELVTPPPKTPQKVIETMESQKATHRRTKIERTPYKVGDTPMFSSVVGRKLADIFIDSTKKDKKRDRELGSPRPPTTRSRTVKRQKTEPTTRTTVTRSMAQNLAKKKEETKEEEPALPPTPSTPILQIRDDDDDYYDDETSPTERLLNLKTEKLNNLFNTLKRKTAKNSDCGEYVANLFEIIKLDKGERRKTEVLLFAKRMFEIYQDQDIPKHIIDETYKIFTTEK